MFTGIVQHVGRLLSARPTKAGRRLAVEVGPLAQGLLDGASLAVNGACLTVAARKGSRAEFDVIAETLRRTTLGSLRPGARVNLERALSLGQELGGHLVQGHVDGLAKVRSIRKAGQWLVNLTADPALTAQMAPQGSVALDGVSLTLVDAGEGSFQVALIPETLARTTLGDLRVGGRVNLETDLIGKYVRQYLRSAAPPGGLTLEKLRQAGYA